MTHKITIQASGMTFTLETSASVFTIGGVMFDLNVPRDVVSPVPCSSTALFSQAQVDRNKIPCIKAVREATGLGLREAKELVERGEAFVILEGGRAGFDRVVGAYNLRVTWI